MGSRSAKTFDVLVGCPVHRREWILGDYVEHVNVAFDRVGLKPRFVFVGDRDDSSWGVVPAGTDFVVVEEPEFRVTADRFWNIDRYERMAFLRNVMLGFVREEQPDLFVSLDSDILLHEDALVNGLETLGGGYDAVGLGCFMTPKGNVAPNYGFLNGERFVRGLSDVDTSVADVLMAAVIMAPDVYGVDYVPHRQGEDIGWSLACRRAGLRFGWDNRATSNHVMGPEWRINVPK